MNYKQQNEKKSYYLARNVTTFRHKTQYKTQVRVLNSIFYVIIHVFTL